MKRIFMTYLRAGLSGFCFTLFGIGGLIIGNILFPIVLIIAPKHHRRKIMLAMIQYAWKLFTFIMCMLRLISVQGTNLNRLKTASGSIIVANHPSLIDIVLLISMIPNAVCVVKSALWHNIFMCKIVETVYLPNDLDAVSFISSASTLLNAGYNLVIFPEGTRTPGHGKPMKLQRGFAHISLKTNAPVIPVHIELTPRILGKNDPWYHVGGQCAKYTFHVHDPIVYKADENLSLHQNVCELTQLVKNDIFV